jgi:hypothetical protein
MLKKALIILVIIGIYTNAIATEFTLRLGGGNTSISGGNSTGTADIQAGFEFNNAVNKSGVYGAFLFGYSVGKIDNKKLDHMQVQYNFGYTFKQKYTPYILFGLGTNSDVYLNGSYYFGAGFKYDIVKHFATEIEYKSIKSFSSNITEPNASNVSGYLSYTF